MTDQQARHQASTHGPSHAKRARSAGGRPGPVKEAQELVTLISALSEQGDAIDADVVAARMGVSREHALQLLYLLVTASATGEDEESDGYLSVDYDSLDHVRLTFSKGIKGRPVRLTETESFALVQALREAGVDESGELFRKVKDGFLSPSETVADVARTLRSADDAPESDALAACATAIANQQALSFSYQKPDGSAPTRRRVLPERTYRVDDKWYLAAADTADYLEKRFRLDRMSDVAPAERAASDEEAATTAKAPTRRVRLTFHGQEPLDLFWWDGLEIIQRHQNGDIDVEVPCYGGQWLARHLAACGDLVTIHDADLAEEARSYARRLLRQASM